MKVSTGHAGSARTHAPAPSVGRACGVAPLPSCRPRLLANRGPQLCPLTLALALDCQAMDSSFKQHQNDPDVRQAISNMRMLSAQPGA
eukprot:253293-Prymnesium_polylepis.1